MGQRIAPLKIRQHSLEFKLMAVQLSNQPGVLIKDVAHSLSVRPSLLAKWRRQVRDGELVGAPAARQPQNGDQVPRLRDVVKDLKRLQIEHELNRAMRLVSKRSVKPTPPTQKIGRPVPTK